jgi:glycosyltransferase involved in cell wall biosynthesis
MVEVLMSTYNGAPYLRQQIDSILTQEGVDVRLVVRDDGSTDATLQVLAAYEEDPRVAVRSGQNLGLPEAFFRLIQESGSDTEFWALADQDDVWLPTKLSRALRQLNGVKGPAMYCSRVLVTDSSLNPRFPHPLPRRGPSFENALVQNIATGCTIVLNREARSVLRDRWPRYAVMHDAWLYLVVSGTGTVVYDDDVTVHYRQHQRNAVGVGNTEFARAIGRVHRQMSRGGSGSHGRQNRELVHTHGALLRPEAWSELSRFLGSRSRVRDRVYYAANGGAHRQSVGSDLVLKGLQVLGRV